jgi:tetratricopeptide (TPR) repeat protein
MTSPVRTTAVVAFLAAWGWSLAAGAAPAAPPTPEQVTGWVRDLGADEFAVREKASRALWQAGAAAEPALREALKSPDAEVARRAGEILDRFRLGIYPDTPAALVDLIHKYQAADANQRDGLVAEFCKQGKAGLAAVRKLAALEENADVRKTLLERVAQESFRAAGLMLADGDAAGAEEVLTASLDPAQHAALRNYAAFHLLRGTLDAKVRDLRAQVERSPDRKNTAVLTYLYRANGDLPSARWAAERSGDAVLLENVVEELGDWPALVAGLKDPPGQATAELTATRAAYRRLAGDQAGCDAALETITGASGWEKSRAYFLNDRPRQALAAFERAGNTDTVAEFLALQMRYREALDLVEKARPDKPEERLPLAVRKARLLDQVGEKEKAAHVLTGLLDGTQEFRDSWEFIQFLQAACDLGLKDQACASVARWLAATKPPEAPHAVLAGLFRDRSFTADVWCRFLRHRFPADDPATTLKRLRSLLDSPRPGPDFEGLAGECAGWLAQPPERDMGDATQQRLQGLEQLAETCQGVGKDSLAQTYLDLAAELGQAPDALQKLADFLADRGRWRQAAERYGQAWEKDRSRPVPLYLRGLALAKAGQPKEGQDLKDRAHLLALANEEARYDLAEALGKRGLLDEATREREILVRTGAFHSVYVTNVLDDLARRAAARKDFLRAADYFQQLALGILESGAAFTENEAYLSVPYTVHEYRARGLLAGGRLDDARKEIDACLALQPGEVDMPLAVVPELEKRGRKAEADALFGRGWAVHEKVCAEFPGCAQSHNEMAWLAARCRRDLDKALEHARRAVALKPKEVSYLDTLAEVHFQRGEREKAVELMTKCLDMDPKNEFYRRQLRRYEAGDPAAPLPEHD